MTNSIPLPDYYYSSLKTNRPPARYVPEGEKSFSVYSVYMSEKFQD